MGDGSDGRHARGAGRPDLSAPQKFDLVFTSVAAYKTARFDLVMAILDVWLSDDNAIVREVPRTSRRG
jgi:hypothetical protein